MLHVPPPPRPLESMTCECPAHRDPTELYKNGRCPKCGKNLPVPLPSPQR